jgi:hypothetical protein
MITRTEDLLRLRPQQIEGGGLLSPFQFLTDGDEHLQLDAWNSQVGAVIALVGRAFDVKGGFIKFEHSLRPLSDRTLSREQFLLGPGALVNLSLFLSSGFSEIGQTFVRLTLIKGTGASAKTIGTLCQGYITAFQHLGFPGSAMRTSTEIPVVPRVITGTDPAAGVAISESVPSGAIWEPLSIAALLVTDATVATRRPVLTVGDAFTLYGALTASDVATASQTKRFTWAVGAPMSAAGAGGINVHQALPAGLFMDSAHVIRITAENLQAADDFGAPTFIVREFLRVDQ